MTEYAHIHLRFDKGNESAWRRMWGLVLGTEGHCEFWLVEDEIREDGVHTSGRTLDIGNFDDLMKALGTGGRLSTNVAPFGVDLELDLHGPQACHDAYRLTGPAHISLECTSLPHVDITRADSRVDQPTRFDYPWRELLVELIDVLEPESLLLSPSESLIGEYWESAIFHTRPSGFVRDLVRAREFLRTGIRSNSMYLRAETDLRRDLPTVPFAVVWEDNFALNSHYWDELRDDLEEIRSAHDRELSQWLLLSDFEAAEIVDSSASTRHSVDKLETGTLVMLEPFHPTVPFLRQLLGSLRQLRAN